jgi:hypothetical protein
MPLPWNACSPSTAPPSKNEHLFHTLAACPVCREAGGWLLELHQAHALPPIFGLLDAVLARSRAEAPQLLQELTALDPENRLARLHAEPRFVSWGLCELLIQESRQVAREQHACAGLGLSMPFCELFSHFSARPGKRRSGVLYCAGRMLFDN